MKRLQRQLQKIHLEKRTIGYSIAGAALLALLLFFLLFKVDKVEIVGSTKHTDKEIKSFTMDNLLTTNTMTATWFYSHIEAKDIPFIDSFDLERVNRHTLRIHVNEKKIIGYVVQGTEKFYFDGDGRILEKEKMTEEEIQAIEKESTELEELQKEAEEEEARRKAIEAEQALTGKVQKEEKEPEVIPEQEIATLAPIEAATENEDGTQFHAAVTDVPRILGLEMGTVKVGGKVKLEEQNIFYAILSITRIVEKYKILPEIVFFDEKKEITLVYNEGNIHCQLGPDVLLEEKITRVASILPQLEDLTGILHLEDYTTDTTNIIFSKESLYSLKYKVAQAEKKTSDTQKSEVTPTGEPGVSETPTGEPTEVPTGEPVPTEAPTGEQEPVKEPSETPTPAPVAESEKQTESEAQKQAEEAVFGAPVIQ